MSRFSTTAYIVIFTTFIISVHTTPPGKAQTTDAFRDSALVKKLNNFVSYVNTGFRSLGMSIRALKDDNKIIKQFNMVKLNETLQFLRSLEPGMRCISVCQTGLTKHNQRCFSFHNCTSSCSVNIAKLKCESDGGSLASVLSQEDNDLITRVVGAKNIMLGGNDRQTEGTWFWPDGSLIKDGYTQWSGGEPNSGQNYDCMYMSKSRWYDCSCTHNYAAKWAYVCVGYPAYREQRGKSLINE